IDLVPDIQELPIIALANQLFQLGDRQSLIQIDLLHLDSFFAKQTLRFPAGGSSGLQIELHHNQFKSAYRSPVRCRKSGSSASNCLPSCSINPPRPSTVMSPSHTSLPG